jgi:hypothetical protein
MTENPRPRKGSNLIAFTFGLVAGKYAVRPLTHILYITALVLMFFLAQGGPINTYFAKLAEGQICQTEK